MTAKIIGKNVLMTAQRDSPLGNSLRRADMWRPL